MGPLVASCGCSCFLRHPGLPQGQGCSPVAGGAVWAVEPGNIPRERHKMGFVGIQGGRGIGTEHIWPAVGFILSRNAQPASVPSLLVWNKAWCEAEPPALGFVCTLHWEFFSLLLSQPQPDLPLMLGCQLRSSKQGGLWLLLIRALIAHLPTLSKRIGLDGDAGSEMETWLPQDSLRHGFGGWFCSAQPGFYRWSLPTSLLS